MFSFFNFSISTKIQAEDYISNDLQNFMWSFLGPDDLCSVSQVCRSFNETSKKDIHWQKFITTYHQKNATEVGFKKYFIQKMREYFKNSIEQKKRPTWLFIQLVHPKNPKRKFYLNKYPFLSEVDQKLFITGRLPRLINQADYDYLFKIYVAGDAQVGKTSFVERYCEAKFYDRYIPTIGVDFKVRTTEIFQKIVKLQIWDTGGQERFRALTTCYYRGSHASILVFDLTNVESFKNCTKWIDQVRRRANQCDITFTLCGTKCDLEQKVDQEEIDKFCEENEMEYFKTSSKDDVGINELFQHVAESVFVENRDYFYGTNLPPTVFNLQSVVNLDAFLKKENSLHEQSNFSVCSIQ